MGKIRAKTLGDQEQEQKEKLEAEQRRQAKIAAAKTAGRKEPKGTKEPEEPKDEESNESKVSKVPNEDQKTDQPKAGKPKSENRKQRTENGTRSAKYKEAVSQIEKGKTYSLAQALELLEKVHLASFDESVELHINAIQALSGNMNLPHGTGKSTRVAILAPAKDAAAADALLKEIETGKITFDVLVATPDAMPRLAKVARILGPKGLMPNPKNGTVTPNPDAVAKQYEGGHMTFKTEAKAPVLHLTVGKLSFGKDKLEENIKVAFKAVEAKNMKKVVLKSTMSPAIRISFSK